jgi:hypothetical protein
MRSGIQSDFFAARREYLSTVYRLNKGQNREVTLYRRQAIGTTRSGVATRPTWQYAVAMRAYSL